MRLQPPLVRLLRRLAVLGTSWSHSSRSAPIRVSSAAAIQQRLNAIRTMEATADAALEATMNAPESVKETELLFEATPIVAKLYGWYWPTSEKLAYEAEKGMLSFVRTAVRQRGAHSLIPVGKNRINTIEVGSHETATETSPKRTLVMCHGYGSGLGLWYRNLDDLANVPGLKTYAIDWLGMGRSSRPSYPIRQSTNAVHVAEDFFVESLEEWRKTMGIDQMILLGHSLGGYLAAVYALKYPERVEKLILASPAGVPAKPEEAPPSRRQRSRPFLYSFASFLVDRNVTPQGILRAMGHFGISMQTRGPGLVKKVVDLRLPHIDPSERDAMQRYLYHISVRRGSGEYALNTILTMPAWARDPLIHRLPNLKVPTVFLYGDHDWMDESAAWQVKPAMAAGATIYQVSGAGHHLYMENYPAYNRILINEIRRTRSDRAAAAAAAAAH